MDDVDRPPVIPDYEGEDQESDFEEEQLSHQHRISAAVQDGVPSMAAFAASPRPQKVITGLEVFSMR